MIKKIKEAFFSLDKLTLKIMKSGFKFCLIISIISSLILLIYQCYNTLPILYYIGLGIFKLSLVFYIEFIICGFAVDFISQHDL